jgi:uncharacterized membrane protein
LTGLLVVLALALNGISAGVLLGSTVGPVPLLLELPADSYVRAKQFLTPRYDPAMPIIIVGNALVDIAVAVVVSHGAPRAAFTAAAVLLGAVVLVSLTWNVPVNNWELTLDPDHLPADWARRDPRPTWLKWHIVRTALLTGALAVTVVGVVLFAVGH